MRGFLGVRFNDFKGYMVQGVELSVSQMEGIPGGSLGICGYHIARDYGDVPKLQVSKPYLSGLLKQDPRDM